VTYGKLRTPAQAARANRLNIAIFGPDVIEARNEPRPFMGPALRKELPGLPRIWANSVSA
jgi:hypothetical protein